MIKIGDTVVSSNEKIVDLVKKCGYYFSALEKSSKNTTESRIFFRKSLVINMSEICTKKSQKIVEVLGYTCFLTFLHIRLANCQLLLQFSPKQSQLRTKDDKIKRRS